MPFMPIMPLPFTPKPPSAAPAVPSPEIANETLSIPEPGNLDTASISFETIKQLIDKYNTRSQLEQQIKTLNEKSKAGDMFASEQLVSLNRQLQNIENEIKNLQKGGEPNLSVFKNNLSAKIDELSAKNVQFQKQYKTLNDALYAWNTGINNGQVTDKVFNKYFQHDPNSSGGYMTVGTYLPLDINKPNFNMIISKRASANYSPPQIAALLINENKARVTSVRDQAKQQQIKNNSEISQLTPMLNQIDQNQAQYESEYSRNANVEPVANTIRNREQNQADIRMQTLRKKDVKPQTFVGG